jgi:competence protein ComGC
VYLNKRKRGYILLEVLILLNVISLFIILNSKTIVENVTKARLYQINDDILTLRLDENNLIKEASLDINNNEEIYKNLIDSNKVTEVNYLYKYSKDSNLNIYIKEGKIFLIRKNKSGDLYRIMMHKVKKRGNKEEIIIIPTSYLAYNLNI